MRHKVQSSVKMARVQSIFAKRRHLKYMSASEDESMDAFCAVMNMSSEITTNKMTEMSFVQDELILLETMFEMKMEHEMTTALVHGRYIDALENTLVQNHLLLKCQEIVSKMTTKTVTTICATVQNVVEENTANGDHVQNFTILLSGIAALQLFVQANYTGPSLEVDCLTKVYAEFSKMIFPSVQQNDDAEIIRKIIDAEALVWLQVDGDFPYTKVQFPFLLLVARILLHSVGSPRSVSDWTVSKTKALPFSEASDEKSIFATSALWCARSIVVHERLLLHSLPSLTLDIEVQRCFKEALYNMAAFSDEARFAYIEARVWLEKGLAEHHFEEKSKGKISFDKAQTVSMLKVQVTGSMGRRTKFQQHDVAQMVVLAKSHLPYSTKTTINDSEPESENETSTAMKNIVAKNVQLEEANPDSILLEAVSFHDEDSISMQNNALQIIDQAILLALCLDVSNQNAKDGLTREQMYPYVARVLQTPLNWMVYSTALLERADLECASSHSRERAVLQLQALVDQHTSRLTPTQDSQAIEESAPVEERLKFIYALSFPPQYQLKSELADKYYKLGVVGSAVEIFIELEMWDEVVECYKIMDKPKRAEATIRERLLVKPSPFMWCSLGDVTGDASYYEKSWELSQHRYARAKRSLGRAAFKKRDFKGCMDHLQESVALRPQNESAWFMLGTAAMQDEGCDRALVAFKRVIQINPENGEAWGNIGSIHYRNNEFESAFFALQEAVKIKRHMWQMWENITICAMQCSKYGEAMYAMHQLLDTRDKHKRPVDHEVLAWLVECVAFDDEADRDLLEDNDYTSMSPKTTSTEHCKQQLAKLLGRTASLASSNAKVWQVYARFNEGVQRFPKVMDCRLKACRALEVSQWKSDTEKAEALCKACSQMFETYMLHATGMQLESCRMFISRIVKQSTENFANEPFCIELEEQFVVLTERIASMKNKTALKEEAV